MKNPIAVKLELKQYFTEATEINSAMSVLLGNVEGKKILEPSVGSGSLLNVLKGNPICVDAIDIDPEILATVKNRLPNININTYCEDFIELNIGDAKIFKSDFDGVISNPPFGLKFSTEYRKKLKKIFPDLYVRESYGLFFVLSTLLLKDEGRFVFLMPDSFLNSKNHTPLRKFICQNLSVSTIIRFPSKRFETVNFGYGSLCIISGIKKKIKNNNLIKWIEAFDSSEPLLNQPESNVFSFEASELVNNIETGWRKGMNEEVASIPGWRKLGDIADCKTGIYTGDNERFIGYDPLRVNKRLNGHPISWVESIYSGKLSSQQMEYGIEDIDVYVPLIRGGHRDFNEKTAWAIKWDKDSVIFYRTNKKARLQNSTFYFKKGLAVPMVSSKRLSASFMENSVFDQGVVGVFPKNINELNSLLIYFNSSIATNLRNEIVNGSANNSANYLKRLPVPEFTKEANIEAEKIIEESKISNELPLNICDDFLRNFTNLNKM